ncbi:hypothetical protein [Sorangium sp. So ce513]|uniref:hypothetical protein n=1 Tax=Sorangium sp. So ce513 TaxID=3133315 RepID=UPI003F613271
MDGREHQQEASPSPRSPSGQPLGGDSAEPSAAILGLATPLPICWTSFASFKDNRRSSFRRCLDGAVAIVTRDKQEERRGRIAMDIEKLLVDFYNGAHTVETIAAWAYVVANRQMVLENLASFERAYEQLIELHEAGKLGVGRADFSMSNLEVFKRINQLLEPGLDSSEARQAAHEIHALAERCSRALKGNGTLIAEGGSQQS